MLIDGSYEVILIKKLNIPYKYVPFNGSNRTYIKDYSNNTKHSIPRSKYKLLNHTSNATVLIKTGANKLYWCPLFEEMYKDTSNLYRVPLIRNLKIRDNGYIIYFNIIKNRKKYVTTEVKLIEVEE